MKPDSQFGDPTGLTIVHHDQDLLGSLMSWGEWLNIPGDDLKATHVEGYFDPNTIAKMNPSISSYYPATQCPWPTCSVLALKPIRLPSGVLVYPHQNGDFRSALREEIAAHIGELYDWSQIGDFTVEGFLARFDPKAADTEESQAYKLNAAAGHFGVCSEWWEARLENGLKKAFGIDFDIFAGTKIGQFKARPADWLLSPMLYVAAVEG